MTGAPGGAPGRPGAGSARPGGDVLVLRALGLGDALTAVPALRGVRRAWPDRRLVLAAPRAEAGLLRDLGVVDAVLETDATGVSARGVAPGAALPWDARGHVAVNLHGRGPQSHDVLLRTDPDRLVAFACPEAGHDAGPAWDDAEHEVARWCRLVADAGGPCDSRDLRLPVPSAGSAGSAGDAAPAVPRADVVLHPGAASASRRWPAARWRTVLHDLTARGLTVALTGSAGEKDLVDQVAEAATAPGHVHRTAGTLDLPGLVALVARTRLVVCGDTGVAHVATATGTPSVLLFGPVAPARWGPAVDTERHTVLWHGAPDAPGDPHGATLDPALARVTTDEVLAAARALLARAH
ncbi:glycosyltransferase family 9 protein [Cellulomonas sp. NS3]|uniref:glycosyltransferase family 9 protein n=1 Tax=Cellulomonas sp. NS3 TaxID=2973977 RepID=UPI0021619041|nr:glycosyltransferase family 9 protein [Cellulomonas sp. NS3]